MKHRVLYNLNSRPVISI